MQGKTPSNVNQTDVVQGAMFIFNMPFQGRPGCWATWPDYVCDTPLVGTKAVKF